MKLQRVSVQLPAQLREKILADAKRNERTESAQIRWILTQYYSQGTPQDKDKPKAEKGGD